MRVSGIEADNRFGFDPVDQEGVEIPDIISLVADGNHTFSGLVESFEFSEKLSRDMFIGEIVWESSFNENEAGEGVNDSVAAVAPKEREGLFFGFGIRDRDIGIIA